MKRLPCHFSPVHIFILFVVLIVKGVSVKAQTPVLPQPNHNLTAELPTVIGPSPEVSALMRFEEVPVNNYTGIPQVDIPVFSTPTLYGGLEVNVGLSYHASSVMADEIAPSTGLGWSLMAGGAISRTVRGLPDEYREYPGAQHPGKIGLYHNNLPNNHSNYYYVTESILEGGPDTGLEDEEFKWDAFVKGKYDTQHDLYQFNFMGHTGRFIIKKNTASGQLEIVPLDDNTQYIIEFDYTYNNNQYTFNGFTIIDDRGIRYVFDVVEMTTATTTTSFIRYFNTDTSTSFSTLGAYPSAFHLSKVYDPFDNLIISFNYLTHSQEHSASTLTKSTPVSPSTPNQVANLAPSDFLHNVRRMEPLENSTVIHTQVNARTLQQVSIEGVAKIELDTDNNRSDTNLAVNSGARRLTDILIKDWDDNPLARHTLHYDYFNVPYSLGSDDLERLILTEVRHYDKNDTDYTRYALEYTQKSAGLKEVIKNPWGYFELEPTATPVPADKQYSINGVLEKMHLPTGGHVDFEFEPGTYSFIGDESLDDFSQNPGNTVYDPPYSLSVVTDGVGLSCETFYTNDPGNTPEEIILYLDKSGVDLPNALILLYKVEAANPANETNVPLNTCSTESYCIASFVPEEGYHYKLCVNDQNMQGPTHTLDFEVVLARTTPASSSANFEYGGGVRVKSIRFFEDMQAEDPPLIRKDYDYSLFSDASKSSGSLAFAKPVFEYGITKDTHFTQTTTFGTLHFTVPVTYNVKTNFNNLAYLRTHGSDVGYKNVTVRTVNATTGEADRGREEYTYLSPIDHPEYSDQDDPNGNNAYIINYPYLPSKNLDYKRGLLSKKSTYNGNNQLLRQTDYQYGFVNEGLVISGIKLSESLHNQCAFDYLFTYDEYVTYSNTCSSCDRMCDFPYSHIQMHVLREAVGRAQRTKKTTREYFYSGGIPNTMTTVTDYTYNATNKRIRTETVSTSTSGESRKTEYLYPNDLPSESYMNDLISANRIADPVEVKTYKKVGGGQTLLARQKTVFSNFNNAILPGHVQQAKGNGNLINRVFFNAYNDRGNILQVARSGGPQISYIWGYNGQYPVAKVENLAYNNIPSGLISAIESASSPAQMQLALNTLRNDPALNDAMVTTYTYLPSVGITGITDPKGNTTTYHYDAFGRLGEIIDADGHLLKEYQYQYRPTGGSNFVKEILYKTPTTSPIGSPSGGDATQNITYMDGLGRPIQQIAHRQSGNGNDLVTHIEYDGYGRQIREYLPYERGSASLNFETGAESGTISFYDSEYGSSYAYSEKELENSPLGRVLRQAAPGDDWAMDNGHEIKFDYETNHQNEVYYFKVNNPTGTPSLALNSGNGGKYGANQLYKTVTKDENWQSGDGVKGTVVEFKDKLGRVVLKRHYNVEPVEGMVVEDAVPYDTYYIYDDYGNLTFVLPPKLSKQIVNGSSLVGNRQHLLNELGYRYRYDHRNRVSAKKIPGKRWEYLVYDQLDRLRATGPVRSPFQEDDDLGWLVYKYDRFDRPVMTLWMRDSLLEDAESEAIHSFRRSVNDQTVLSEYRVRERLIEKGIFFFYSKQTYPIADFDILAVYYYDTYDDFDQALNDFPASVPSTVLGQPVGYNNSNPPVGMPTGSWVRVLESDSDTNANTSYTFYDDKGRALRTHTDNYLEGYTRMDREFDFTGKVLKSVTSHQLDTNANPTQVEEVFTYTDQERPVKHSHRIGTQNAVLLSHSSYDALGQLTAKRVGGDPGIAAGLQVVDYSYNIRGWLTGINNISNLLASGQPQDLFAFRIRYNNAIESTEEVQSLYNGNIAQVDWRTSVDNVLRRYSYGYDRLNRLTEAWYQVPGTGVNHSYDEYLAYDRNGNITALERYGEFEEAQHEYKIDNLVYDYDDGNKLINVTDETGHSAGFDDANVHNESGNDDFEYDVFGNLVIDRNKDITSVSYNHLNLPKKVVFHEGESEVLYLYDANGVKMEKITKQEDQVIKKVNYQGAFQYTDEEMDFIQTAEGYTKVTHSEENIPHYNYVFNYTDHLGNVRVSWTQNPEASEELVIIDDNHYYPFGLRHKGYQSHPQVHYWATSFQQVALTTVSSLYPESYKYKFNGKEYQSEMDINLYDFGARNYDPALGRWMNVDPLAEKLPFASPYAFALNNPIVLIDPDGRYPIYFMTRSYAPFKTFGPGYKWHGDDRGHSSDRYASYRTRVIITHDTELKTTFADGGRSRSYTTDGKKDAYSTTYTKNRSKGSNIDVHSYGGNEAQFGAPDIDQFTKLTVNIEGNIKKDHILSISGTISGDDFPNQESLIYDANGNTLWLGNFETSGDRQYGPATNLWGSDEGDVQINVNVRIKVNKDGIFQGVMQKGEDGKETMISIEDWNKKFEQ